jgi:hypothetical protein
VAIQADGGVKYLFTPNEDGHLVCDVGNPAHAAWMLGLSGNFFPADGEESDTDTDTDLDSHDAPPALTAESLVAMLDSLDKSGLIEYAHQNGIDGIDGRMSVATLRARITEAMNG